MRTRFVKEAEMDFNNMTRMTIPELCQHKHDSKIMKEVAIERCAKLANRYAEQIREAIMKFKNGELDYVSIILLRDELIEKFMRKINEENLIEHVSAFDVKHIWKNALKKLQGLL